MTRPQTFHDLDLWRRSDPPTSRAAGREIRGKLAHLHRVALDLVERFPGRTGQELSALAEIGDPRTINRRLGELEKFGRLVRGEPRACEITGRAAATWWTTSSSNGRSSR
jgi:hypothetical protein